MRKIKEKIMSAKKMHPFFFLLISFVYSECIVRAFTCSRFFTLGLINIVVFSAAAAALISFVSSFFKFKINLLIVKIIMLFAFIINAVQTVYHLFFGKYLIFYSLTAGGTEQIIADGLLSSTLKAILGGLPAILLLLFPVIYTFVFAKHTVDFNKKDVLYKILSPVLCGCLYVIAICFIALVPNLRIIYQGVFDPNLTVTEFGLLQTEIMDITYNVLGIEQNTNLEDVPSDFNAPVSSEQTSSQPEDTPKEDIPQIEYLPQIMDIDFSALAVNESNQNIKTLHEYFKTQVPSYTNEYTGKFKDYNLIYITAEGFSPYAIDKDITPTLYKMANSGFKFNNFYTPIWGVSTSDGEYVNCTGLIPKSGVWSFYRSSENSLPFCLGNQFKKLGVTNTYAYHNHTYSFYHRDDSHPNMGYTYLGYGNGLEKYITKQWPESDLELIECTTDMYLSENKPFHAYYMTVSGHLDYTYNDNSMVAKNWDSVKHLECSDLIKGYYACHVELDKALEELLSRLQAAGVADKTLIVIAPDHYPYGLETLDEDNKYQYFNEILGREIETNFELYKSTAIIYSPSMSEPVTVDKYCSSLDLLPTISNLLGLEFDSRLLMGRDIFSDSEQFVVFQNRSWITKRGMYNTETKEFTAFSGYEFENEQLRQEYILNMNKQVSNKFKVSAMMLDNDYYSYVLE